MKMYGDGSIFYNNTKKRWQYTYRTPDGKQHRKTFYSKDEAKQFAKAYINTKDTGLEMPILPTVDMTVGQWLITYTTTYCKPRQQETSWKRTKQTLALTGAIANRPLNLLTGLEVQTLLNDLGTTKSSSTTGKVRKLLNAAYVKAMALKLANYNPVIAVEKIKEEKKPIEILTGQQLRKILQVLRNNKIYSKYTIKYCNHIGLMYYLFFLTLLVTGLRLGELLALQWKDVDLENRIITVRQNKKNLPGLIIGSTKTAAGSHREIPLVFPSFVKKIRAYKGASTNAEYVFSTKLGTPLLHSNVEKKWQAIRRATKCEEIQKKTIHCFRHTFATVALSRGIPILEISRIIGHKDASTTLNKYGHAIPNYNQKIIEMFSGKK